MIKKEGFTVIANKILRDGKLSIYEKVLFAVLLSYNGGDKIYPSHATLAKQAGISQRQTIRTLKQLKDKGYILIKRDPSYRSNIYTLTKKGMPDSHTDMTHSHRGGDSQSQGGVTHSHTINKSIINKSIKKDYIYKGNSKKHSQADEVLNIPNTPTKKRASSASSKPRKPALSQAQIKKEGKYSDLITQIIELFNAVSGSNLSFYVLIYRTLCLTCIKCLRIERGASDGELLDRFKYVFENKKKQYDDPDNILSCYNLPMLLAKKNFNKYLDELPCKTIYDKIDDYSMG
jgi:predicted transcriptional regulator